MKKITLSLLTIAAMGIVQAQTTPNRVLDKNNMREGESVEYCITHKKQAELLADPVMAKEIAKEKAAFEALMNSNTEKSGPEKAIQYTIPVVFHVLHNGGSENISKEQIMSALAILNRDYAMLNADTISVQAPFQSLRARADIKFELATKAPDGTCFSGITRTLSPLSFDGSSGSAQISAIVSGNDVYQNDWPGNKYLNIYICAEIGGAAGYTMLPAGWSANSMQNGIFILHTYLGNIGTSSEYSSRALTHEVGHWLNLDHVWGGNNNPGSAGCGGTDNVQDTPATQGSNLQCNLSANSCSTDNGYWGFDQIDNVENYMDYSYCSKMFTTGQVTRMRTALTVSGTGRANVISASNLNAVGAGATPVLCQAKFSTPKIHVCAGETVDFTDESYNAVSGWTWSFPSGTPVSATTQNASTTWNTPGTYTVTLTATDGSTTDNYTMIIVVLPNNETLPFYESFEGMSNFNGSTRWFTETPGNSTAWAVTNTAGKTGTNSVKLANFGQSAGVIDRLTSGQVDLSGITATEATFSFRYAYRKRTAANSDQLKVFFTTDCGETWNVRKTLSASTMTQGSTAASTWTPTSNDWVTVHVTNMTSSYWVENFRFRFEFTSGGGNNIYIDDINIYEGPESNDVVAGLDELASVNGAILYPNPADNELNVKFNATTSQAMRVVITDITGKIVQTHSIQAIQGENMVFISTEQLAAGSYFLNLTEGTAAMTLPFVVK